MRSINKSSNQPPAIDDIPSLRAFVLLSILTLSGCGAAHQQDADITQKSKDLSAESDSQPKENQSIVSNQQSAPEATLQTVKEEEIQKEVVISPPPPELSDFVRSTLKDLKDRACERNETAIPEIRGIIKGDNIEALAISYGGNVWGFSFNPSIKSKASEKMFGLSFNDDYTLNFTGAFEFNEGVMKGNNGTEWLLGEMKSVKSFKNPRILWAADEESPGLADRFDCAQ